MSKHVSFPASHLSAFEVGKRVQVVTVDGAKITDTLTGLFVKQEGDKVKLFVQFGSINQAFNSFEVNPDQFVKRIDEGV